MNKNSFEYFDKIKQMDNINEGYPSSNDQINKKN